MFVLRAVTNCGLPCGAQARNLFKLQAALLSAINQLEYLSLVQSVVA
jgi:hypothetical protein